MSYLKKLTLSLIILSLVFISSCWDRTELDEQAIWLATAWDVAEDGKIEVSGQIVIPGNLSMKGEGSGDQPFYVVSSKGDSVGEVLNHVQEKLSRKAFVGQRKVILFSEEFAKKGLKELLDNVNRTPLQSLRGGLFIVKEVAAKEALKQPSHLEKFSAIAILKEHRLAGGRADTLYLQFLIAANKDGVRPTLPILEISGLTNDSETDSASSETVLRLAGVSIFDEQLKMQGMLNNEDNRNMLWVMDMLHEKVIDSEYSGHAISAHLYNLSSKITAQIEHDEVVGFTVHLKGTGILEENNSSLDMRENKNVNKFEKIFKKKAEDLMSESITKVQNDYGLDIFGFGELLHRKHPTLWNSLKDDWDEHFSDVSITVEAEIKLKEIGLDGPSILFKRSGEK